MIYATLSLVTFLGNEKAYEFLVSIPISLGDICIITRKRVIEVRP